MESGIESQPSPVSILFFASILILARLFQSVNCALVLKRKRTYRF